MPEQPGQVARRLPPDVIQLQVILGSRARPATAGYGSPHRVARAEDVRWKYERLGSLVAGPPEAPNGLLDFTMVAHSLFDDLAVRLSLDPSAREALTRPRREALALLAPLGLLVWLTDLGRPELCADAFLPTQRTAVLAR